MRKIYTSPADFPDILPVFPLSGTLLLPRVIAPLNIFEPRYVRMIDDALAGERLIGIVQPDTNIPEHPDKQTVLNQTACVGRIISFAETDNDRILVSLLGISRFKIMHEIECSTPYRQVVADFKLYETDLVQGYKMESVNRSYLLNVVRTYIDTHDLNADWDSINNSSNEELVNSLSVISPLTSQEKQALLEAPTLAHRANILIAFAEILLAQAQDNKVLLQ